MKINFLLITLFVACLFQNGIAQTTQNRDNIRTDKIELKSFILEQDSTLATWPVLVSVDEAQYLENPEIEEKFGQYDIKIFPEPEKGIVYIQFDNLDRNIKPELFFCNEKGEVINNIRAKTRINVINLRKVPPGTYLITTDVNEEISTWEITKE